MKKIMALALLMTSTFAMANSINAFVSNDAIVKSVIKSVEAKYQVKCNPLDVKADKNGVIKATTNCFDINPTEDSGEGSVSIEIDGEIYGEGKNSILMITNIGFVVAG